MLFGVYNAGIIFGFQTNVWIRHSWKLQVVSFNHRPRKAIVNSTNLLGETPLILSSRASADAKDKQTNCRLGILDCNEASNTFSHRVRAL